MGTDGIHIGHDVNTAFTKKTIHTNFFRKIAHNVLNQREKRGREIWFMGITFHKGAC